MAPFPRLKTGELEFFESVHSDDTTTMLEASIEQETRMKLEEGFQKLSQE